MDHVSSDKSVATENSNKFSKPNNFIKIKSKNIVVDQVATTSKCTTTFSFLYNPNHKYTKLFESLYKVMTKLIHDGILKLPPIHPIDTSKLMPKYFDLNSLCQYHHQPSHDTQRCYTLNNSI